ncbi:carbonic anhydrase 4 [Austrofundulus limnaeus]|uniref:Carbonic anhydrase n=1 Tax=Austrofundulus limnaeus TaxID=52670 RepID=A0A2I4BX56_AUSLI|nr:PREDICTED: carbonic anhydrase 4-like [Austrofundulus limnaeus]
MLLRVNGGHLSPRGPSGVPALLPVMGFCLYLLTLLLLLCLCTAQWCYQKQNCDDECKDPSRWPVQFPRCGGSHQSPVNIVSRKVQLNSSLPPFSFIGHVDAINVTVKNNGHYAHFGLPESVRLAGGGLPGHYRAFRFHFHWGGGSGRPGSEHTIDGERYPMELHIVHIKEPFHSLEEAEQDTAGIALLAFLFEETAADHPHLDSIIAALGRAKYNGSNTVIPNFRLNDIIPAAKDLHSYYRYVGSMTTPGCEQAVEWTVFHRTLSISSRQLDAIVAQCQFWTGQPMTDIYRPTQPLDGRVVYSSKSGTPQKRVTHLWISVFSGFLIIVTLTH